MTAANRERRVQPEEVDYLGPVAVAMFVDLGWIIQWPMGWSRDGLRAIRNGYGRWEGSMQNLPIYVPTNEQGAAHWEGRRVSVNGRR